MSQNLFKIYGGRTSLLQWETKQKLIVLDDSIKEVHFSNRNMNHAIVKDVLKDQDGLCICEIPDALLMLPKNLVASAYVTDNSGITRFRSVKFAVMQRPIPSDYIVSEDFYFEDFDGRLKTIEGVIKDSCLIQKFNTLTEAEQWAQESKDSGAVITVNIDSKWVAHMVEDDYSVTPIFGGYNSEEIDNLIKDAITALNFDETISGLDDRITDVKDSVKPFFVVLNSDTETIDKTTSDITAAVSEGRQVLFVVDSESLVPLGGVVDDKIFIDIKVNNAFVRLIFEGNKIVDVIAFEAALKEDIPTKVSQLENDKEYLTAGDIEPMEPIFVHMGVNHSVDVSSDEIVEASNAGLQVFLVLGDMYVPLSLIAEGIPYFATVLDDTTLTMYIDGNTLYFPSTYRYPAIHSEETVKVGQTLVVKSVDADGIPTKWEPVDVFRAQIITWEADD